MTGLSLGIPMLLPIFAKVQKSFFTLFFSTRANKGAGIDFVAFGGDTYETTETDVQIFISKETTLLKNNAEIPNNSSDNILEITFRDDSADIPSSKITVPASTTGSFSSGDIEVTILAGSKINEKVNRLGTGNITDVNILAELEK